jgi:hypothetical protein
MPRRPLLASLLVTTCALSCGGGGNRDSDQDQETDGDGGQVAADGSLAADASPEPNCPDEPPADGSECTDEVAIGVECAYEQCATTGLVRAECATSGNWSSAITSCSDATCNGETCGPGTVCTVIAGGALIVGCNPHTCDGPLECDCVCPAGTLCQRGSVAGIDDPLFSCLVDCGDQGCP